MIENKFKIIDAEGQWIVKDTFEWCKNFLNNSLKNKYLSQKRVKLWQIVRDI
jgi:hypothetical protein